METNYSNMSEIVLYGYAGTLQTPTPKPIITSTATLKNTNTPTSTVLRTPTQTPTPGNLTKIEITEEMIINESMSGDAFLLFDENVKVGNPPAIKP